MMESKELTFEEALKGLKECSDNISLKDNSLESAFEAYNKGIEYYNICQDILNESKQKIEVVDL